MSVHDGQPEEFRPGWAQTWSTNLRPTLPLNILLLLLCWVLGYIFGGTVGSVVLPVVVVGGLVAWARYASWAQGVRVSAYGVEFLNRNGSTVRMRWDDIERIAILATRGPGFAVAPTAVARGVMRASSAAVADANTGPGLVGLGERLTAAEAKGQWAQGPAWVPVRPTVQMLLRLTQVDRNWQQGSIGDWMRRYRPDLLPPLPQSAQRGR